MNENSPSLIGCKIDIIDRVLNLLIDKVGDFVSGET